MKQAMNERYKALQTAAIIIVVMIITGCDHPQQNTAEPEWKQEIRSAKTEHELKNLIDKYCWEWSTRSRRTIELLQANRYTTLEKLEGDPAELTMKLYTALVTFLIKYPHSPHYAGIDESVGKLWEVSGLTVEEIQQKSKEIIREQRRYQQRNQ